MLHDFPPHKQNYLTPQSVAKTVIYQLKHADKEQTRETAIPASRSNSFHISTITLYLAPSRYGPSEKVAPWEWLFYRDRRMPSKSAHLLGNGIVSLWQLLEGKNKGGRKGAIIANLDFVTVCLQIPQGVL